MISIKENSCVLFKHKKTTYAKFAALKTQLIRKNSQKTLCAKKAQILRKESHLSAKTRFAKNDTRPCK